MSRTRKTRFAAACGVAALLGAGLASGSALAATATSTFQVTADVIAGCTISAGNMNFGNYDALAGTPLDATSTISVTCTDLANWTIELDGGGSGDVSARQMSGTLNYGLYTDSGYGTVWGDGTLGSSTVPGTGTGSSQSITVHGRIPIGQTSVPVGSYSDSVDATINF